MLADELAGDVRREEIERRIGAAYPDVDAVLEESLLPEQLRETSGARRAAVGIQRTLRPNVGVDRVATALVEGDMERRPGDPQNGLQIEYGAEIEFPGREGARLKAAGDKSCYDFTITQLQIDAVILQCLSDRGDAGERTCICGRSGGLRVG